MDVIHKMGFYRRIILQWLGDVAEFALPQMDTWRIEDRGIHVKDRSHKAKITWSHIATTKTVARKYFCKAIV